MSKTFARALRYKWQFFWAGQFIFLESKVTLSVFGCFLMRPCLFHNLPGIRKGQVTVRLTRIHSRSYILFVIRKMFSTLIFSWIHWSPFDRNQWRSQRHRWSSMSLWSHNCSAWANPTKSNRAFPQKNRMPPIIFHYLINAWVWSRLSYSGKMKPMVCIDMDACV